MNLASNIWVFPRIGVPQNGWFIRENPIKMDDLVVPLFLETPIFIMYWFPTIRIKSIKSTNRQSPARPQQRLFFFKKNTSNQDMANPRLPNTLGLEVFGPQKHTKNTEPQEVFGRLG